MNASHQDPADASGGVKPGAQPEFVNQPKEENKKVPEEVPAKVAPPKPKSGEPQKIKMVLVGDTSVGKTCLIHNYINNTYSEQYEPTVLDVYRGTKNVKGS